MANKNVTIKKRNASNTGWDEMYPVTTAENVKCGDGSSVEAQLGDIANVIVASGTGTAISLSMPSVTAYIANMKFTFIPSANNNGSATTININNKGAKNLYKPNTTTAPIIKSGKPYTVWYDGTNFFLQASAEGNAVAGDVLAGKMFSTEEDTGILGTMNLDNLIPSNVRQGININGVTGTLVDNKKAFGTVNVGDIINIDNLAFTPKYVIIYATTYNPNTQLVRYIKIATIDNDINIFHPSGRGNCLAATIYVGSDGTHPDTFNFTSNGFNTHLPMNSTGETVFKWIAFG